MPGVSNSTATPTASPAFSPIRQPLARSCNVVLFVILPLPHQARRRGQMAQAAVTQNGGPGQPAVFHMQFHPFTQGVRLDFERRPHMTDVFDRLILRGHGVIGLTPNGFKEVRLGNIRPHPGKRVRIVIIVHGACGSGPFDHFELRDHTGNTDRSPQTTPSLISRDDTKPRAVSSDRPAFFTAASLAL